MLDCPNQASTHPLHPTLAHHVQMRIEQEKQRSRAERIAATQQRRNALTRGVARAALQARFAVADHMSSALILAVFGFKVRCAALVFARALPRFAAALLFLCPSTSFQVLQNDPLLLPPPSSTMR